eukprot:4693634-Pyramimonas_sp.AAC.1
MAKAGWCHCRQSAEACRGPSFGGHPIHSVWTSPPPMVHWRHPEAAQQARSEGMEPPRVLHGRRAGHRREQPRLQSD